MVRSSSSRRTALGLCTALAVIAAPGASLAQPAPTVDCNTLPNVTYGMGGSAQLPLVRDIAIALAGATPAQTIVYNSAQGACSGINSLVDGRSAIPATTTYWTAAGLEGTCNVPAGTYADFGLMGNQGTLCSGITEAKLLNIRDVHGPIGSVNVLALKDSTEYSISAEALHFIYAYGPNSGVSPWTGGATEVIRRNNSSFVKIFISIAAGLPTTFTFFGTDAGTNANTITLMTTAYATNGGNANSVIGFASGDVADENREIVRTLAYKHTGQDHAYWPDSNFDTFDKQNIRNGQYYLWAPAHFYARYTPANGQYESALAAQFLGYIGDTVPAPTGVSFLDIFIDGHSVPLCAMEVGRAYDLGPLYSYQPDEPCGCYFEDRIGTTTCTACTGADGTAGNCPGTGGANICRHGFCEVQ